MKKLLLLLPMLATVSMYGVYSDAFDFESVHRFINRLSRTKEPHQNRAHLHSDTAEMDQPYPYQSAVDNDQPRTMYDEVLAANPNTTFVHYETGKEIKPKDLPGNK